MDPRHPPKLAALCRSRWVVLVASIWLQACAGIGYAFGSFSPLIKSSLNYNQKQINRLGVAKDIGDSVGLIAGSLSEILPTWGLLLMGATQNIVGYGWLWLIVTRKVPKLPYWLICVLICLGTNGETFFNTASLVSCVRNFPKSRGPTVGILKGFTGLCGAIFTQIYATFYAPDQAAFIFIVAVGPFMVACALMFIIRPIEMRKEEDSRSETVGFTFIYCVCLILAAYLMGVMLVQDFVDVSHLASLFITVGLLFLIVLPLATPFVISFYRRKKSPVADAMREGDTLVSPLLSDRKGSQNELPSGSQSDPDVEKQSSSPSDAVGFSEFEEEKPKGLDLLPEPLKQKKIAELRFRLWQAAAEGAVRVKRRKGPRRGEDFTLFQALVKADFWLLFWALFCGAGSGLTVIDNLGQMSESQGYENSHIFVSMMSIWNFLGRLLGGYISESVSRHNALPRPLVMALAQIIMAVGHFLFAMAWPGSLYAGTLLVGLGYGAHWSIVPAAASELFGLKSFGMLYNFLTIANPAGSLVFSGLIAGSIYDSEAAKQRRSHLSSILGGLPHTAAIKLRSSQCKGASCFRLTYLIMTGICIVGVILSLVLSYRTMTVYSTIYGKQQQQEVSTSRSYSRQSHDTIKEEDGPSSET